MKKNSARSATTTTFLSPDEHLAIEEHIRRRAHEIWLSGGMRYDSGQSDWLQAEEEVLALYVVSHTDFHSYTGSSRSHAGPLNVEVT